MYNRLDRETAGPTDRDILPRHSPRYAYASRGKNCAHRKKIHEITKSKVHVICTKIENVLSYRKLTRTSQGQEVYVKQGQGYLCQGQLGPHRTKD